MKKSLFFALFAALPVMAQEAAPEQCPAQKPCCKAMPCAPAMPCCGKPGSRPDFHKMMLEKFDANKDGQLDDAEKAAAKADFEAKRAEMKADFEKKMLEKFDANKDGQLDDAEKAAAKAEFEKMRAERGPKGPKCGRHGHHGPKGPHCCGKPGPRPDFHKMMLEKFDANKDGQLDDAEKAAAKAEFEKNRAERGPKGPKCGRHGHHGPKGPHCCGKPGSRPDFHKVMLEKFDANKDGQLDDAEKAAAKADFEAKRAEMKAAFEKKMLEKFDANKDGQLDDAEKAAAKAEFEKMRAERGPKGPKCGRRGHHGPQGPRCCPCGPKPEKKCDAPAPAEQPAA